MIAKHQSRLAEAKARWLAFCTHTACAMIAGELSVLYRLTGNNVRALAQTRVAIGEAAAIIGVAIDLREEDAAWSPVCEAMLRGANVHVSGLERQLSEFQRSARIRTQPSRADERQFTELLAEWTAATINPRSVYESIGGDPSDLPTFFDFRDAMKAGALPAEFETPSAVAPWPAMED